MATFAELSFEITREIGRNLFRTRWESVIFEMGYERKMILRFQGKTSS